MNKYIDFKNKLASIYNDKVDQIIKTHYEEKLKSFRINLLKSTSKKVLHLLKLEGLEYIKSNIKNAYSVLPSENKTKLSESVVNINNEIYIQELSSMLSVIVLNPKTKDYILDLCASPGSKTTQIASITKNLNLLVAVEKQPNRFYKMKHILNIQGAKNVQTILCDGNKLLNKYPQFKNFFTKITLDVPCTNEASIDLNDKDGLKFWHLKEAKNVSKLQKGLINSAFKMLKLGGVLIYSTCTYSVEENEMVIDWFLNKNPNAKLEKISLNLENINQGLTKWKDKIFNKEISKTVRILPNNYFKGFFLAKIKKY